MDGRTQAFDRTREQTHLEAQSHADTRLEVEAPGARTWEAGYTETLQTCETMAREALVDGPALAWESAGPQARRALEALAECLLARDADGLSAAAESFHADEVADGLEEVGEHIAPVVEGACEAHEHDEVSSLADAWRDVVREGVLALSADDAKKVEETARVWTIDACVHAGQIRAGDGPETVAEDAFAGTGARRTGPLARARIERAARASLGFEPGETPDDEPGLDAVREALRDDDPTARALVTCPPLHERLEHAKAQGVSAIAALTLEQAAAGPCLDAPHASTLARVRGAMLERIDPARRAREDCVRAVLSAARDALHTAGAERWEPPACTPGALARGVAGMTGVHPAFAAIVQSAREAAAAPDIGRVWAFGIETAARSAPPKLAPALEAALASAKDARPPERSHWAGPAR